MCRDAGGRDDCGGGGGGGGCRVGAIMERREGEFDGEEVGSCGRDAEGAEGLGDLFDS